MDPLTQGILGAALPQCLAREDEMRQASYLGFLAGLAPDLDVFIRSAEDPLLFLDYHRHFTHSLIFIPVGGLLTAVPLFFILQKKLSFLRVWLFAALGYATHGLLDACTSYGTQLLWPFSSARIAWSNVAVVDFWFTLPLGVLIVLAFFKKRQRWARTGIVFALLYLLFGVIQRERAVQVTARHAEIRGHSPLRLEAKPTLGNFWLWRSIYEADGSFYVDAVWTLPWAEPVWYEGGSARVVEPAREFPALARDSIQFRDLERFAHFSDNFIARKPGDPSVVGDLRYALLPQDLTPLWGIRVSPETPERHVSFHNFRNVTDQTWSIFGRMLRGLPLHAEDN